MQRINYDAGLDDTGGGIFVYGKGGNDTFASDDTSAPAHLFGEGGADTFQIGQLFGSKRDGNAVAFDAVAGIDDRFQTTPTTRGWLSNGISRAMTASGGDGERRLRRLREQGGADAAGQRRQRSLHRARLRARSDDGRLHDDVNNASCQIVWRDDQRIGSRCRS